MRNLQNLFRVPNLVLGFQLINVVGEGGARNDKVSHGTQPFRMAERDAIEGLSSRRTYITPSMGCGPFLSQTRGWLLVPFIVVQFLLYVGRLAGLRLYTFSSEYRLETLSGWCLGRARWFYLPPGVGLFGFQQSMGRNGRCLRDLFVTTWSPNGRICLLVPKVQLSLKKRKRGGRGCDDRSTLHRQVARI